MELLSFVWSFWAKCAKMWSVAEIIAKIIPKANPKSQPEFKFNPSSNHKRRGACVVFFLMILHRSTPGTSPSMTAWLPFENNKPKLCREPDCDGSLQTHTCVAWSCHKENTDLRNTLLCWLFFKCRTSPVLITAGWQKIQARLHETKAGSVCPPKHSRTTSLRFHWTKNCQPEKPMFERTTHRRNKNVDKSLHASWLHNRHHQYTARRPQSYRYSQLVNSGGEISKDAAAMCKKRKTEQKSRPMKHFRSLHSKVKEKTVIKFHSFRYLTKFTEQTCLHETSFLNFHDFIWEFLSQNFPCVLQKPFLVLAMCCWKFLVSRVVQQRNVKDPSVFDDPLPPMEFFLHSSLCRKETRRCLQVLVWDPSLRTVSACSWPLQINQKLLSGDNLWSTQSCFCRTVFRIVTKVRHALARTKPTAPAPALNKFCEHQQKLQRIIASATRFDAAHSHGPGGLDFCLCITALTPFLHWSVFKKNCFVRRFRREKPNSCSLRVFHIFVRPDNHKEISPSERRGRQTRPLHEKKTKRDRNGTEHKSAKRTKTFRPQISYQHNRSLIFFFFWNSDKFVILSYLIVVSCLPFVFGHIYVEHVLAQRRLTLWSCTRTLR